MERDQSYNIAKPTREARDLMRSNPGSSEIINGWHELPNLNPITTRISQKELAVQGAVDAYEVMEPFLGNKVLDGTLRTMDVLNGCGRQCDTCCIAAVLPNKIFTFSSLDRLFSDKRFIRMLQPSLRIGSTGDIEDHPEAVGILSMILSKVPGEVKVYTNYRPKDEEKLDGIIRLARANRDKMHLNISLPRNRNESVGNAFMEYIQKHPATFGRLKDKDQSGETRVGNISIQDVGHMEHLFSTGRVLSSTLGQGTDRRHFINEGRHRSCDFENRGSVKTYFNPDALWLMVYATVYESVSGRTYTPLTPENIALLSKLPYNCDFPTPKNWPGGKSKIDANAAWEEELKGIRNGKKAKPLIIIED